MNTILERQETELITNVIQKYVNKGKTRQQIYDDIYDPDDQPGIILAGKFMKVYDELYPPISTYELDPFEQIPNNLRDYQIETVTSCIGALATGDRCYIQLPTGAGKTRVMYKLIDDDFESVKQANNGRLEPGGIVYICMSPRIDLANQHFSQDNARNIKTKYRLIHMHSREPAASVAKSYKEWDRKKEALIITALYQSVSRLRTWLDSRGLVRLVRIAFSDEAHLIARWCQPKVLEREPDINWFMSAGDEWSPEAKFVNLSATPTENQVNNLGNMWGPLIKPVTVGELITRGILCPIETLIPNIRVIQATDSRGNSQNTLDLASMCEILYKSLLYTKSQKAVVFCNTTAKCKELRQLFELETKRSDVKIQAFIHVSGGIDSEFTEEDFDIMDIKYDAEGDKSRGEIALFEKYKGQSVVFTCKRISLGYDFPPVDFVGFCDPKCSRAELSQAIGRCLRMFPGKPVARVFVPITPEDYSKDSSLKRRHLTLFEYLNYLKDEVGFDYRIRDRSDIKNKTDSSVSGGSVGGGLDPLAVQPVQPIPIKPVTMCEVPGYNFLDRDRVCLILAKECIFGQQNGTASATGLVNLFRTNNVDSPDKYREFWNSHPELHDIIPEDYKELSGFRWKDIVDPIGTKYYPTRQECDFGIFNVMQGFQRKFIARNIQQEEYLAKTTELLHKPYMHNVYDPRIPLFEPTVYY